MKNSNQLTSKVYRLKTHQTPLSCMIDTGSAKKKPLLVWDENKKENRAIRYAANQPSPFVDEQDDNPVLSPIVFEDGFLQVAANNPTLQRFLELHPKNNKLYEEINEEQNAAVDLETLDAEDDARQIARSLTIEQCEMIGRVLLGSNINNLTSAELKRDVRLYATNYPEEFLEILDDPDIKLEHLIVSAFDQKIIAYRNNRRDIHWNLPENKKRLITIPKDVEPRRALIAFLISNEGKEPLAVIEKLVE